MNEAISKDLQRLSLPDNDCTKWADLLPGSTPAQAVWLSGSKPPLDTVTRAATLVGACSSGKVQLVGPPVPLRWGKLAMDGLLPFKRCLHATMAVLSLKEAAELATSDVVAARGAAGRAYRHINSALPWRHDASHCPYGLSKGFQHVVQLCVDCLTVTALRPPSDLASATRRISLLQIIVKSPASTEMATTLSLAKTMLATEILSAWVQYKTDPRHGAPPAPSIEGYAATVASIIMPLVDPDAIDTETKRFVAIENGAYGLVSAAREYAVGHGGALAPLLPPSSLGQVYSLTETMTQLKDPIELPTVPF